ncbi:hypothetical protein RB2150_03888 [Rhodobacterales bacterium HTCC2150]|nr:hypothetical protein RB2150_03888 [Rhodobacterales bacterium HTCC2150] [Rhodobacteraceae bacterium HTCC2150]
MGKRHTTLVLRDDPRVADYVEFLRDELGDEKLVQKALTQPFYAAYRAHCRYGGLSENLKHFSILISCSGVVAEAIEISRKYPEEPEEEVLQRILFNYLQVDAPPEAYKH